MVKESNELSISQMRRVCSLKDLNFASTEKLPNLNGVIGQDRAMKAVNFGLEIKSHGYHIYAIGPTGTGKATIIRKMLEKSAKNKKKKKKRTFVENYRAF